VKLADGISFLIGVSRTFSPKSGNFSLSTLMAMAAVKLFKNLSNLYFEL